MRTIGCTWLQHYAVRIGALLALIGLPALIVSSAQTQQSYHERLQETCKLIYQTRQIGVKRDSSRIETLIARLQHPEPPKSDIALSGIYCPFRSNDSDNDGLDDDWELRHGLHPCDRHSVDDEHTDYEVIAYIEGYGNLVRKKHFWEYDWADCGLQKGSPRNPFPWSYVRLGREASTPFYSDLLTEIPTTR